MVNAIFAIWNLETRTSTIFDSASKTYGKLMSKEKVQF